MQNFKSIHNLIFEQSEWKFATSKDDYNCFKIGTIYGLIRLKDRRYEILNIENKKQNNGHLNDFFEWMDQLCKLTGNSIYFPFFCNERFKEYLIREKNFVEFESGVIKYFDNMK
jgi:hypothetical protein